MKKTLLKMAICIGLLNIFSSVSNAQTFTANELINSVSILEQSPFDKNAKTVRGLALGYVIETKDVSVLLCGGNLTEAILHKKNKNSAELTGQYVIAMAAFKLQNPDKKDDENAEQLAGIESVLRTYEAMIKAKPKTKFAGMDDLLQKREKGELPEFVEKANCKK